MNTCLVAITAPAFAAVLAAGPAPGGPPDVSPVCASASHAVLKAQEGRDVCAPTVLANGRAVAVGFLPTACPRQAPELAVDAVGIQDVCRPRGLSHPHAHVRG